MNLTVRLYNKRRKALGLSHQKVAPLVGLHWKTLFRYEVGLREPSPESEKKLLAWINGESISQLTSTLTRRLMEIEETLEENRQRYENLLVEKGQVLEALLNAELQNATQN